MALTAVETKVAPKPVDEIKPAPKPVAETTGSAPTGENVASADCEQQTWPHLSRVCMEEYRAQESQRTGGNNRQARQAGHHRDRDAAARASDGARFTSCGEPCRCRACLAAAAGAAKPAASASVAVIPPPAVSQAPKPAPAPAPVVASVTPAAERAATPWPRSPLRRSRACSRHLLLRPQRRRPRAKRRKSATRRRRSENRKANPKRRRNRTWMTTAIRSASADPDERAFDDRNSDRREDRLPPSRSRAGSSSAGPNATTTSRIPGADGAGSP